MLYLNGRWVERDQATVSVEDRGFMFADGVYEVIRYCNGRAVALDAHLQRLRDSLEGLRIDPRMDPADLGPISDEALRRNNLTDAMVYWQVTRGAAPRNHRFPAPDTPPTVLVMAKDCAPLDPPAAPTPCLTTVTAPDIRWGRCAIKSISLLPNVLAAQAAAEAGCDEAIMIADGIVTEGAARTIAIVKAGVIMTHPLTDAILPSITRQIVLDLARRNDIPVDETYFPPDQLFEADEVLALGTTTDVAAVTTIDDRQVADGQPGPVATRLSGLYRQYVAQQCGIDVDP